jgi:predicted RNA binding protein YcfA (HicA-like mRNA interferase family)
MVAACAGKADSASGSWKCLRRSATVHHVPRNIRQLVADLERAGFYLALGGKGSHRKFRHERRPGALILSGKDGDDAQHYQEKQTRDAIREISQ